ncbi:hypothetical protein FHS21_001352 [Phyllobacterium trifolii]|uniref:Uncharacterized protein n=1 Tax=Phyllobacterium trifolii TaxID=300193 RepID=A0A839U8A7_9HYPH|nr:hypothetical protein [Phyllobacterium trifolii]MBB3144951.1 hypothetical protein [Phyllobacterium trifolii]
MRLIDDWRSVLRKAWSMRLMLLAGLLSGIEAALPLLDGLLPIPQRLFAVLTLFAVAAAFVARLIAQNNLKGNEDANQQDQVKQPRKGRHRRSYFIRFCHWLVGVFLP